MQDYNNIIIDKIVDYVSYVLGRLTTNDESGRTTVIKKFNVVPPDNLSISELITNGLTHNSKILFVISILDSDGNLVDDVEQELVIPMMINNTFVYEGSQRTPTQTLDNDFVCRIYKDSIQVNQKLRIEYTETGHYTIRVYTDEDEYEFSETDFIKAIEGNDMSILSMLKLSEYEVLKFKVKLNSDNVPEILTPELIRDLINLGTDKMKDSIIDKTIVTTETSLMSALYRSQNMRTILQSMRKKFYQYGTVYLKDIQNVIDRFFKIANDTSIDIPNAVNPLGYDSLRYKITMPGYVAYNDTMTDLIDPVNTPENTNVNRINELNVCASVKDGIMYITCYELSGAKVTMEYVRYLNHHVLQNIDYDYDKHEVIKRDKYAIKLRYHIIEVDDLSQFSDLIVEPKADEKLSITTRRLPMINMSDTVRVAMGAAMSKQAIEVEDSEIALVNSGNDDEDLITSTLITRFNEDEGVVDKISGTKIFIKYPNGTVKYFQISQPTVGANDSVISFDTNLKVGDKLKKGDVIIMPKIIKRGSYESGINANAVYMNYLGMTHEDAFVISKSFADKISSYGIIKTSIKVKSTSSVEKLLPIGSKVKSKDVLVRMNSKLKVGRIKEIYEDPGKLLAPISNKLSIDNLEVPNNVDEGYVIGVLIEKNEVPSQSETTLNSIERFEKTEPVSDWDVIPDRYKNLPIATDTEFYGDDSYCITYQILKVNRGIIGTKLCNRYGSKGMVSLIIPDHLMPRLDEDGKGNGKPFDIIFSPPAVISRKNPSQLYELLLTKVIYHVFNTVKDLIKTDIAAAKDYTVMVYGDRFSKLTDEEFLSEVKKGVTSFNLSVGSFAKISYEQLNDYAKYYNLTETQNIYCPDIIITNGLDGIKCYDPMTTNINNLPNAKLYELGFIENPVVTGTTYVMKLYHSADYVGKVTPLSSTSAQPYLGRGNYREEGQKLGEMQVWALMSHGTESFIRASNPRHDELQYEFLNELLLAGYAMVDDKSLPLLSKYRTSINKLIPPKEDK